jgi:hypothetical protein
MSRTDLALLRDAIDMHAHTHPALFNRPIDDADLAQQAIDFGMRGVVLKDHDQATMGRAYHVSRMYPETVAATDPFTGKPLAVDPAGSKISSAGPEAKLAPNEPIEWILRAKK